MSHLYNVHSYTIKMADLVLGLGRTVFQLSHSVEYKFPLSLITLAKTVM